MAKYKALLIILLLLPLTGCGLFSKKDPFKDSYWAEADNGFPALCTKDGACYQPSKQDQEYFKSQLCEVISSET